MKIQASGPTSLQLDVLPRGGWPYEPSGRPLGRPFPGRVGEGGRGGEKTKHKGSIGGSNCGEDSEALCCDETHIMCLKCTITKKSSRQTG